MAPLFRIDEIIDSPLKLAILRIMANRQGFKATGRKIAELSGYSAISTHASLKYLHSRDILTLEIFGKQHIYGLNEENRIVQKVIRPFFEVETGFSDEIKVFLLDEIKKAGLKKKIISLILYGSFAKGTAKDKSDVDVAVVVIDNGAVESVADVFISTIAERFKKYFGIQLDPYVKSVADFKALVKNNQPPVSTLMKSYFLLYGKEPLEI